MLLIETEYQLLNRFSIWLSDCTRICKSCSGESHQTCALKFQNTQQNKLQILNHTSFIFNHMPKADILMNVFLPPPPPEGSIESILCTHAAPLVCFPTTFTSSFHSALAISSPSTTASGAVVDGPAYPYIFQPFETLWRLTLPSPFTRGGEHFHPLYCVNVGTFSPKRSDDFNLSGYFIKFDVSSFIRESFQRD